MLLHENFTNHRKFEIHFKPDLSFFSVFLIQTQMLTFRGEGGKLSHFFTSIIVTRLRKVIQEKNKTFTYNFRMFPVSTLQKQTSEQVCMSYFELKLSHYS